MQACTSCGRESEEGFAFCPHCGSRFVAERILRKVVTVLFCDVVSSTKLGETVDVETARSLLARYFARMKSIVEAHGGVVDKFIGDAVMAVFGVPVAHEDDALRAVHAAAEMQEALPDLELLGRIGVNTGEAVVGTAERLVTGDAVNVASRLEKIATPGTVLLGARTFELVQRMVEASPVGALQLRGKSQPVHAWELLSVHGDAADQRPRSRMVGRKAELKELFDALGRASRERSCQLLTLLGGAGVGKSRLVLEFLSMLDARVVSGRCLSYGKGITYWPVVEVLKQLDALPKNEAAAAAIGPLLEKIESQTSANEIAWAFRELLEQEAQDGPLVCVLDDLHWGEETFLDLVEEVASLARDAPILLLCMARPDMLERRPTWADGKPNATTTVIQPLDDAESARLLNELGGVGAEDDLHERICAAAEGNPLFLEELQALVHASGSRELAMPATIQALLAARLDQLDSAERIALERGAVAGRVFHESAVRELLEDEPGVTAHLDALVRKELIQPHEALIPGDNAFRFRHQLIRDVAYDALPKAVRAELHQRFADWLGKSRPHMIEVDELIGYHLEQAAHCQADLGAIDPDLLVRAAVQLAGTGNRAFRRGDWRAATNLLERALALTGPGDLRASVELDLADVHSAQTQAAPSIH